MAYAMAQVQTTLKESVVSWQSERSIPVPLCPVMRRFVQATPGMALGFGRIRGAGVHYGSDPNQNDKHGMGVIYVVSSVLCSALILWWTYLELMKHVWRGGVFALGTGLDGTEGVWHDACSGLVSAAPAPLATFPYPLLGPSPSVAPKKAFPTQAKAMMVPLPWTVATQHNAVLLC